MNTNKGQRARGLRTSVVGNKLVFVLFQSLVILSQNNSFPFQLGVLEVE